MALQFDTRDKKPKLYSLLILTVIVAAVIVCLVLTGAERHATAIFAIMTVYSGAAVGILIYSWKEQIRYNPYSYNTILYMGFALFVLSVMLTNGFLLVRSLIFPEWSLEGYSIVRTLLGSAKIYMLISAPFILVFSVALCVSNISLIRYEGFRPVNLLGIVFSLILVAGEVFIFVFDFVASGSLRDIIVHELITNTVAAVYLYLECMLIGTLVAGAIAARYDPDKDRDFLIILGCGLKKDGTPSRILQSRIERAMEFAREQKEKTGKDLIFITSGGKGSDERCSESASMKRYLVEHGIPEDRIIEEDRSTTTYENMLYSSEKIRETGIEGKIAYATSNYHVFRSGIFARRMKMRAVGVGAKTKWYFWPNAAVREFASLLTNHRLKQAIILLLMIAFFVGMTFLAYSG